MWPQMKMEFTKSEWFFYGSWHTRGHTSLHACGAVVEAEIGLIIDHEVVSKFCEMCTKKENLFKAKKISEEQYSEWLNNTEYLWQKNYTGSSDGMKAAVAVTVFGRSLDNKLRYVTYISDGDTSAYDAVCTMNDGEEPYGNVKLKKKKVNASTICLRDLEQHYGNGIKRSLKRQLKQAKCEEWRTWGKRNINKQCHYNADQI